MPSAHDPIVVPPGGGRQLASGQWWLKADTGTTNGGFGLIEMVAPPGGQRPRPHAHRDAEEMWYVIEGRLAFHVEARTFEAAAGSFVVVPRGLAHTFWNADERQPSRYLLMFTPAGLEGYFEELGAMLRAGPPDLAAWDALGARYGTEFRELPPPTG
jgi:mannose-6-phosphate isomerase-like protein (cupin superfamily)